jgi:hydrogenase maturation protein HypF
MKRRLGIEVRGMVQGVGFRPYVYRLALRHGLTGTICNSGSGVLIEVQGDSPAITSFRDALPREAPPLARLHQLRDSELSLIDESTFSILESQHSSQADTLIAPDIATCNDCIAELRDPHNRRYKYPFLNCTNCGPRFTITRSVPYDRSTTSMAGFTMCERCRREYDDPTNRRFHAQPNACWDCGPQLQLIDQQGNLILGDPVASAMQLLKQGCILAIKGLGGFHLAVDARQPHAIAELRRRKHRAEKPLAVMVAHIELARHVCHVSGAASALLESPQRPIVLLPSATASFDALAPDGNELGIFLPYTPVHHLLLASPSLDAIVMTSGNRSDEPIAIGNAEALTRLGNIADYFLVHNREILLRCDDSVIRIISGEPQFVRRSRGYVPAPIQLGEQIPPILAVGAELKNTICLARGEYALPGQHIGDLQELSAYEFFQESIAHLQNVLEVRPVIIAHDLHPGYMSTHWAMQQRNVQRVAVQHHHAHIASCMAEHRLHGRVLGIALDGTGYGTDGHIWGGEILIAGLQDFTRAAHFAYLPMLGGEKAIHEPWRMALSYLWQAFGPDWRSQLPPATLAAFSGKPLVFMEQLLRKDAAPMLTSSCGRLFDAVAALVCRRMSVSYEAQAAIQLEACCDPDASLRDYPFSVRETDPLTIETMPLFAAIASDLRSNVQPGIISRRFHNGLARVLTEVAVRIAQQCGLDRVCLSGGILQNAVLSQQLTTRIAAAGLTVFRQTQVSSGDGGLSLGQLRVAASRYEAAVKRNETL